MEIEGLHLAGKSSRYALYVKCLSKWPLPSVHTPPRLRDDFFSFWVIRRKYLCINTIKETFSMKENQVKKHGKQE